MKKCINNFKKQDVYFSANEYLKDLYFIQSTSVVMNSSVSRKGPRVYINDQFFCYKEQDVNHVFISDEGERP